MGATGPCGPCSEIHIDLRSEEDRQAVSGDLLVNRDHPRVIEIWNLVFIQYNRNSEGILEPLPARHIDTGMGFERLCQVLQGVESNYETDLFQQLIEEIQKASGVKYTASYSGKPDTDTAMRVVADHVRAVSFAIADGAIPSNTGPGYVIRRILRRAVRYYYSFLEIEQPLMHQLVPILVKQFGDIFPEIREQQEFIANLIREEEKSFLRTLASGLSRLDQLIEQHGEISGNDAFELYDTYGFPIDLTRLIARERQVKLDESGFEAALAEQKQRSRQDASQEVGDWQLLSEAEVEFVGYDSPVAEGVQVLRYRTVEKKDKKQYQLVLDRTPFYAEGGGQVGDTGILMNSRESIKVVDTQRENELIIHIVDRLPSDPQQSFTAHIDEDRRERIVKNHSATHLLHAALREVLGTHVQQKGSLVKEDYLRFDFSHFQKMSEEEIEQVEGKVNAKIRENHLREEARKIPLKEAKEAGAMMLFGEKYGEEVRMITFDPSYSRELCGGCHVERTGDIGFFKIVSESAIAAGIRRIEARTALDAENYIKKELNELHQVRDLLKGAQDLPAQIQKMVEQQKQLTRELEQLKNKEAQQLAESLKSGVREAEGFKWIADIVKLSDAKAAKNLVFELESKFRPAVVALGVDLGEKAQIMIKVSDELVEAKGFHAGKWVKESSQLIRGGGGGQASFASAGGSDPDGLSQAMKFIENQIVN